MRSWHALTMAWALAGCLQPTTVGAVDAAADAAPPDTDIVELGVSGMGVKHPGAFFPLSTTGEQDVRFQIGPAGGWWLGVHARATARFDADDELLVTITIERAICEDPPHEWYSCEPRVMASPVPVVGHDDGYRYAMGAVIVLDYPPEAFDVPYDMRVELAGDGWSHTLAARMRLSTWEWEIVTDHDCAWSGRCAERGHCKAVDGECVAQ